MTLPERYHKPFSVGENSHLFVPGPLKKIISLREILPYPLRKMSIRIDTYRDTVFGKQLKIMPVRVKIMQRLVPAIGVQFESNIMNFKGRSQHAVKVSYVCLGVIAVDAHKIGVAHDIK